MLYILAGITGICALICAAELLIRVADRIGLTDKLFRLFDLPAEKGSAPNAATSEGTKIIYLDEIVSRKGGAVK